ncbi:hypothetical protein [Polaribacter sp.]|uniref:hypothetical protein n=1 Tax=Polaribacter sp. TaxID=1920175 RepID=UPI0025EC4D5F|nr:hypothetical protein [Polaribacter sp.]
MGIKRYKGQPKPIVIVTKNKDGIAASALEVYNKTYADILEVAVNLKKNLATDQDVAYLQKLKTNGGITIDTDNHTYIVSLNVSDYTNLPVGNYYLTLNIQVSGIADFIEIDLGTKNNRLFSVVSDTNRA